MRTVTFYSYKGGTGRSLLLANLAMLVARLGRRVVALDLDLEAPGLHYKLLPGQGAPATGAVDWLAARRRAQETPNLADITTAVPVAAPLRKGGELTLIPAGRAPSGDYFELVQGLHLDEWLLADGVDAFLDLAAAIEQDLNPDYLFIDSRTGITTSNAVTTRVLADAVVVLTLDSAEQLEGTRAVLRTLQPLTSLRTNESLDLHVVHGRSVADDRALNRIRSYLVEPGWPARHTVAIAPDHCHSVRHDQDMARAEFLPMALPEPHVGPLHKDYLAIANALFPTLMDIETIASVVAASDPESLGPSARFFGLEPLITDRRVSEFQIDAAPPDIARERIMSLKARPQSFSNPMRFAVSLEDHASAEAELGRTGALSRAKEEEKTAAHLRQRQANFPNPATAAQLASSLDRCSHWLRLARDYPGAIKNCDEAVTVFQELVGANPVFYTPSLASSLYNYAALLTELGHLDEAAYWSRETVLRDGKLASTDSARYTPNLASSLHNYATQLTLLGRYDDASPLYREAINLHRTLASTDPAHYIPCFAESLNSYALHLSQVGRHENALQTESEAVILYRRLARTDPVAHTPSLASFLHIYAYLLTRARRHDEAVKPAGEAVALYQALAEANPDAYADDLAQARSTLADLASRPNHGDGTAE